MHGSNQTTPVEEVVDAAKDTVLGDERAAPIGPEEGMDHSMVVNQQVERTAFAEGSKGEGLYAANNSAACWVTTRVGQGKKRVPMCLSQTPT